MPQFSWENTKRYSKKGFDKAWDTVDKLGAPVNRLSYKLGTEAFWPMTIDKESDKAARILRSFCKDGFYAPESTDSTDSNGKINRPKGKQRVLQKIPAQVIQNAKGLAIFTTMRTGLWVSGSGGSGVLLARIPETGEWSPPSGIMLHTAGIGFLAGVDIYDCVVIINTYEALDAFKKVRCTLGGEVSATAGPVGMGGILESEVHKRQAPIYNYMKSKGLYAGVSIDGTVIIERTDENERFYGERISVSDILAGKLRHPPHYISTLLETVKAAQGDVNVDENLVPPPGETPGDVELANHDMSAFGVPAVDDPDPFGVKALEAEGLFIREAGSKIRPTADAFEFRPSPSSPIYATFPRRSLDSSPRTSWRASVQSYTSVDRGTQTDDAPLTATTSVSRASSRSAKESTGVSSLAPWDEDDAHWDTVPIHGGEKDEKVNGNGVDYHHEDHAIEYDDDDLEVHEVSNATVTKQESVAPSPITVDEHPFPGDPKRFSPNFTRARLVTIPKRSGPPALPPRHPQHIWGSGSSRASTSPTALSHSSHSTEPTENTEPIEPVEPITESVTVKQLQTTTAVPAVDENEDVDSASELPTDKDEFHSMNGDHESDGEDVTFMENHVVPETERKESVTTVSDSKPETKTNENEQPEAEEQAKTQDSEGQFLDKKLGEITIDDPRPELKLDTTNTGSSYGYAA
ncbi:hypothetical protein NUU61_001816 [Penicillium alfredii]|uniref:Ysc84 actin-binding domain-containing protein n=1 Tax=Penicillium alfredii TaxID=1506179 RepID=A0A9W9FQD1_9EURO|nr:uncharacterized protein NUU61_001816 [Penicillium alfredii]KAJ5104469.1 hypothetical protein NUU61_001816 [Penicillium alfredii]